ncbi:alkaline phosphatase family protein [Rhodococcus sp. IEGM 1379]|uniref:alkaline phosphatase family protein n=1 Tax=Rhodococcus sp. IEGM 1379 TaxID=3047086 RepID=UPI0024B6D9C5|nr:alkaline phosphatase family protein [Rhodococcus sp. IEGM 1379]MDI9918662.1 alkaline phosphatase family protein [Rhodococcus sp. IEGM 1379]
MSSEVSRRQVLIGGSIVAGTALLGSPAFSGVPANMGIPDVDVYVMVVDGMRPDELRADLTPMLTGLAAGGIHYPNASAINIAETLPNHTAMMTGVYPARSGVPANSVYDPAVGKARDLDRASDLQTSTVLERVRTELGLTTASVLSKHYLHGLFGDRASVVWDPQPLLPGTAHAPDNFTIDALIRIVGDSSPRLSFTNLGDVDRVGHLDLSGPSIRIARTAALQNTDNQVRRFVDFLHATGRWNRSIVIVLADHSMDWSEPARLVGLDRPLNADPLLAGKIRIAQNGGADLIYFVGPDEDRSEATARIQQIVGSVAGVESSHLPAEFNLGANAGDVVAFCSQGWRFSDPTPLSNPIPGNHGHSVTLPIPFFLSGGHPALDGGRALAEQARTIDVAPTVAALLGLGAPVGGWDGVARTAGVAVPA